MFAWQINWPSAMQKCLKTMLDNNCYNSVSASFESTTTYLIFQ